MKLKGLWNRRSEIILTGFMPAYGRLDQQLKDCIPKGPVKTALLQLYSNASALAGTLVNLCKETAIKPDSPVSSQVVGLLLRSLIEAVGGILVFCKAPETNASLYHDFAAVLDLRFAINDLEANGPDCGCPIELTQQAAQKRKDAAWESLRKIGPQFLTKKKRNQLRRKAQAAGSSFEGLWESLISTGEADEDWFPRNWCRKDIRTILKEANMEWLYLVFYRRYSSAVHSDVAAGKLFDAIDVNSIVSIAHSIYDAGIDVIIETFRLSLPADARGAIRLHRRWAQNDLPDLSPEDNDSNA